MRRSVFLLTPLIPLAVAACEDGPSQPFTPALGIAFNSGDTPSAVADAGDPLSYTTGGATKTQICNGPELQTQWGAMIYAPIAPARYMAGIDLDDGPQFPLLTVEKAETGPTQPVQMQCGAQQNAPTAQVNACAAHNTNPKTAQADCGMDYTNNCQWYVQTLPPSPTTYPSRLCQPTVIGSGANGGDVGGSLLVQWGNNGEFQMEWAIPTHKAYVMNLNPGYYGHMTWNYRTPVTDPTTGKTTACSATAPCTGAKTTCDLDNQVCVMAHSYDYEIGYTIKKDGQDYIIHWSNAKAYPGEVDELYRGIASTFAPDIFDNAPAGTPCTTTGTCLAVNNAGDGTGRALFGMRPVSFYMFFNPPTLPPPSGYTVQSAYLFNIKYAPYSGATSYFKMYDGPADGGVGPGLASNAQPFADKVIGTRTDGGVTLPDGGPGVGVHCHFGMGDNFQNLLQNCIDVFADDALNQSSVNKVLGALAHDDQNFTFSVVGINQNFHNEALDICANPNGQQGNPLKAPAGSNCGTRTTDVLHDTDTPLKDPINSIAVTFNSDVRSFGAIQNDAWPDATVPGLWHKDYHGAGAIWREYGRMVQTDLAAQYTAVHGTASTCSSTGQCSPNPKAFRDTSCYLPMACNGAPTATSPSACGAAGGGWAVGLVVGGAYTPIDPTAWRPAAGCTGFEGFMTNAEPLVTPNYPLPVSFGPTATAADDVWDHESLIHFFGGGNLKPGTPSVVFCNDPGEYAFCAFSGDLIGSFGDLLNTSTARVLQYLGGGNTLNLPLEARDRRYFFKKWSEAYAKYLTSPAVLFTGKKGIGPSAGQVPDFSQTFIDTDNFIFASFGGGASRSEYISFDFADNTHDPLSLEQKILLIGSNLQATNFYRKLDREERALFNSLAADRTQASWGYLHDSTGALLTDLWPVPNGPADCTKNLPAGVLTPNAYCATFDPASYCNNVAPALRSTLVNVCVHPYPRRNANPFLTNLAGSAAILAGASATLGNTWIGPGNAAPLDWFDPCNATGVGQTCDSTATTKVCPGQLTCCNAADADTTPTGNGVGCKINTCVYARTPYYCATHYPDTQCLGYAVDPNAGPFAWPPPLDPNTGAILTRENGKPLFEGYCGIWQTGPFALQPNAINPGTPDGTPAALQVPSNPGGIAPGMTVVKTFPDLGEALVQMPSFKNPYFQAPAAVDPPVQVMVPWTPKQEGVGYPVMATGTRDVFVNTAQLDFTGQVVTPVIDFFPVVTATCKTATDCPAGDSCNVDPTTKVGTCVDPNPSNPTPPYGLQIQAFETQDFLGDVFMCVDPITSANRNGSNTGDMLVAHMYSSAETVVNWLAAHPGAQDACGIIVRYSPYDNYPDFIQTTINGVRLGVEQGSGYGRIADVTVFAPGSGTPAAP